MRFTDPLTTENLKKLATYEAPVCLTLTMPCVLTGNQQKQNPVRFKNLLQDAQKKLKKTGWRERKIKAFLKPAEKRASEKNFAKYQNKGLLVCVSEDMCEFYSLPFEVDTHVIVDRHFYLRPVIPKLQNDREIPLFLLNMEEPKLVIQKSYSEEPEIHRPPPPYTGFVDYMDIYDTEESLQYRSQGYDGGIYFTEPGYHGQGTAGDEATEKTRLKEYFKKLENWVREITERKSIRELFLVTESKLEGLYKNVTHDNHPALHLLAQTNSKSEDIGFWLGQARKYREKELDKERQKKIDEYNWFKEKEPGSLTETIPDIVLAALNQRIDTLILPDTSQDYYWGRLDDKTPNVTQKNGDKDFTEPGDELVNLAVIKTYLNGGKIFTIPEHSTFEKRTKTGYAALCRWQT